MDNPTFTTPREPAELAQLFLGRAVITESQLGGVHPSSTTGVALQRRLDNETALAAASALVAQVTPETITVEAREVTSAAPPEAAEVDS